MTFLKLGYVGGLSILALTLGTACSNNPAPAPKAAVVAVVQPGMMTGVNDTPACGSGDYSWQLAANGLSNGQPTTADDGSYQQGGGAVHVNCSVDGSGDSFNVQLFAELDGPMSGSFSVSGTLHPSGASSDLSATFTVNQQTFRAEHNCTFSEMYNGHSLPSGGQPATGRIWGNFDCQFAANGNGFGMGADGGAITRTCWAHADVLFENCN
jgi:hypothetical protein